MNKYTNILLIFLTVFLWGYTIKKESKDESIKNQYIKKGDMYFNQKIYLDALDNYKKADELKENKNTKIKIFNSYLGLNNFEKAFEYLNSSNFDKEFIGVNQEKILNKLINDKNYKSYNKYLKLCDRSVYDKFNKKYFGKIIFFETIYEDINYIALDIEKFIVKNGKWNIINNSGKIISPEYDKIYGFDEEFITVKYKNENLIIDKNNEIRGKLSKDNEYNFQSNFIVVKEEEKYNYATRAGEKKLDNLQKASNFQNGKAVVYNGGIKIINENFDTVKNIEGRDFKVDNRNNAIYNNKIIIKINNKYKIYDIENDIYSQEYEDIDFDYGELIAVKKNDKWGYISPKFEQKIDFIYDNASSFSNQIGIVKNNRDNYLIDKNNVIIEKIDLDIFPFNKEGVSFAKKDNKYIMIRLMRSIYD